MKKTTKEKKILVMIALDQEDLESLQRHFMINRALYDDNCITATDYILLEIWNRVKEQLKKRR